MLSFSGSPRTESRRRAIAILNTQYFKITIWSIAHQFGIAIALLISSVIVLPRVRYLSRAIALLRFLRLQIEQLAVIDTPIDYCTASDCLRAALNPKWLRFSSDRES
ncbi:hypothetical protein [Microcoleus sp. MON2_D5]|uniref:hypothetical protein n=1 Tax=Microcoleus sp. MON2_D5 TaxID=2818833 RepID=UPI002FD0EBD5